MTTKSCFSKTLNLNIIQYKHHYHHHNNKQATATLNNISVFRSFFVRTKQKNDNNNKRMYKTVEYYCYEVLHDVDSKVTYFAFFFSLF